MFGQPPPPPSRGVVVFRREDGNDEASTSNPIHCRNSISLRDLGNDYNVSSVLECEADGSVKARAVVLDSPSDMLRGGRHYVARRDAQNDGNASRVTFRGKILVKEFDLLEQSSTLSSNVSATPRGSTGAEEVPATAGSSSSSLNLSAPHVVEGRKRSRGILSPRNLNEDNGGGKDERIHFEPFTADVDGSGVEVPITIDYLANICSDVVAQEEEYARRHSFALSVLTQARASMAQRAAT